MTTTRADAIRSFQVEREYGPDTYFIPVEANSRRYTPCTQPSGRQS